MNRTVQEFLIKSQNKVIGHYRQVLQRPNIPEPERQAIRSRLAKEESALEVLMGESVAPDHLMSKAG